MLTICPRITASENSLTATSSFVARLLTLGLKVRHVRVDRDARVVTIRNRFAWFWSRTHVISFNQISAVTYGYEEAFAISSARDPIDRFVVGLRPNGGEEILLFSFLGDGTFTNDGPLPDWWYWKEFVLDYTGSQQHESRAFAVLLSRLINVTLQPSTLTGE